MRDDGADHALFEIIACSSSFKINQRCPLHQKLLFKGIGKTEKKLYYNLPME
jgi:hypothetical protein